jgi:glycosyltransferase involved in cell wall biosynthesis
LISVIIPLMPIPPYSEQVVECLDGLNKQTAKKEIFVAEQPVERYINKNKLLNQGFKKSKGDLVFHCDADFLFPDNTLLERMEDKIKTDKLDCLYPKFFSWRYRELKIADGGGMFTQDTLLKTYPLNENLLGISWVTIPLLNYCIKNLRFHCSDEFVVETSSKNGSALRRHGKTASRLRPLFKETVKMLKARGAWPA